MVKKFQIQNRRFLGNKFKLLDFIENIVNKNCNNFKSFCDIFAGTGVVGDRFNKKNIKIISNDLLYSSFVALKTFLGTTQINETKLNEKIDFLNNLKPKRNNYFSIYFGNTYFTLDNARKIGAIREKIEKIAKGKNEKYALITSLIYAADKVANTVGHYDAFREDIDAIQPLKLLLPDIKTENNKLNEVYREDANVLIKNISCDILYIDPPYNRRKYIDLYHVLENLAMWEKPKVYGKTKKFDRSNGKSRYNTPEAVNAFRDLVKESNVRYILVSYSNLGNKGVKTSQALIPEKVLIETLKNKGKLEIFSIPYKPFNAGKSTINNHQELIYFCKVK